jgi:hypothetical protein
MLLRDASQVGMALCYLTGLSQRGKSIQESILCRHMPALLPWQMERALRDRLGFLNSSSHGIAN